MLDRAASRASSRAAPGRPVRAIAASTAKAVASTSSGPPRRVRTTSSASSSARAGRDRAGNQPGDLHPRREFRRQVGFAQQPSEISSDSACRAPSNVVVATQCRSLAAGPGTGAGTGLPAPSACAAVSLPAAVSARTAMTVRWTSEADAWSVSWSARTQVRGARGRSTARLSRPRPGRRSTGRRRAGRRATGARGADRGIPARQQRLRPPRGAVRAARAGARSRRPAARQLVTERQPVVQRRHDARADDLVQRGQQDRGARRQHLRDVTGFEARPEHRSDLQEVPRLAAQRTHAVAQQRPRWPAASGRPDRGVLGGHHHLVVQPESAEEADQRGGIALGERSKRFQVVVGDAAVRSVTRSSTTLSANGLELDPGRSASGSRRRTGGPRPRHGGERAATPPSRAWRRVTVRAGRPAFPARPGGDRPARRARGRPDGGRPGGPAESG